LNPEHPGVQKLARGYAAFCIFIGIFVCVAAAISFLPRAVRGMSLLALPTAIAGAWLLRPRMPQADLSVPDVGSHVQRPTLLSKHWRRNLAIATGFMGFLIVVLFVIIGDSDVSKLAFAAANTNRAVTERLGQPIKRGFFISGTIEISGPSGHADISIPVKGPKGEATIYAVAQKRAGLWKFETLEIAFDDGSPRMNLLKVEGSPPAR
jgi:hypothetical protein